MRIESRIFPGEFGEAAQKKAGTRQQHQRKGDLCRYQQPPETRLRAATRLTAP
jgi:hypothetical protein